MFNHRNDIFIVSPHIDDAIFSLGGLIDYLYDTHTITIINIFSDTNFLIRGNKKKVKQIRKSEDRMVKKEYPKLKFLNLDFPDALIRGYSKIGIFSKFSLLSDKQFLEIIKDTLNHIIKNTNHLLLVPSGYGSHIDHLLLSNLLNGKYILYYEDLPYAARQKNNEFAIYNNKNSVPLSLDFISNDNIKQHLKLITYYESQLSWKHYSEIYNYLSNKTLTLWKKNSYSYQTDDQRCI